MTSDRLVKSYLEKAKIRIKALHFMHQEGGYSDVVREAQECVELLLKALLRNFGTEIPKVHDVSQTLVSNKDHFPVIIQKNLKEICDISRAMRKDRELAFYGTEDWIPTDQYSAQDSLVCIDQTEKIFAWVNEGVLT